jgi:mono/diheme cytochrome c family protein
VGEELLKKVMPAPLSREGKVCSMEKRFVQSFGLILIPGILVLGFGCASRPTLAVQDAGYTKDKVDAHGLYLENCTVCHGKDGRAKTFHGWLFGAQNLADAKWQADTADEQIVHAIRTGPWVMPAFGKKLSPAEIDALAAYVRSFKPAH